MATLNPDERPLDPQVRRCWSISPFFNELDVLEVKLAEQAPFVDVFVLAEATKTYAGTPKPLHLTDALAAGRFAEWAHKIRVVVVDDDPPSDAPFQPFGEQARWMRENHQRRELRRGMTDLQPTDVVCLSDVDEIVRGSLIRGYMEQGWDFLSVPPLTMHVASIAHRWQFPVHVIARLFPGSMMLPCPDPTMWTGVMCGLEPEEIRRLGGVRLEIPIGQDISYYGWHLSWMGGANAMRYKMDEAAHPEMNEARFYADAHLAGVTAGRVDLFGRDNRPSEECPRAGLPNVIALDFKHWQSRLEGDERVLDQL